jgi:N4-(beta-N-acetylglucosaminyl)-L-asparaginase
VIHRAAKPVVIASANGNQFKNGGDVTGVQKAFDMITAGEDVLDAVIAGVNLCELDPEDMSVGYGGLPNADGVVQLDSCCMHGPKKRAGGVACLEGVRTPSLVARAVCHTTDHHLLVGKGAQDFARSMGFEIEEDLNTEKSRATWLEWKRRSDPEHYLDPEKREVGWVPPLLPPAEAVSGLAGPRGSSRDLALEERRHRAALSLVRDGLVDSDHMFGTINMNGVNANGDVCGVTTTSGLSWKIPGRVGDSPILGAGLWLDNAIGAAGSTGRGEANLYNLCSFLIVENLRRGMTPKDAGMDALKRVRENTIEKRLLHEQGNPNFGLNFYVLAASGEHAGVSMYPSRYAICSENGPETLDTEPLLEAPPRR